MARAKVALTADEMLANVKRSVPLLADTLYKLHYDEGLSWDKIGKEIGLPGYCLRVLAGEIRANRPVPKSR